ncbi:MAG: hypothetical protein IKF56_04405 [Eggerthellaceae bacterium]|nr:hypothetical protein [Eggerthellaceae bacterium]
MLFVLTGGVQTGKTRWLEDVMDDLRSAGIQPCGALAPGVWADRRNDPESFPRADENGFEKLGIDNILLPSGERIAFARRTDLATAEGSYDPASQSGKAKLGWHISDEAIERVNGHFASLRAASGQSGPQLLVIDELGRLELERGEGLTEAVAILEDGPTPCMPHALVVVREMLLPHIEGRFESWGETVHVSPDAQSRALVLGAFTS